MISPTKYIAGAGRVFNVLACACIIAMMLLSTADVIMRFFGRPIPGTYELVGFFGTLMVSFALAFTSLEKGHIAVEILVSRFPQRIQFAVESFGNLLSCLLFGLIAWQAFIYAADIRRSGEVSLTLQMPVFPFIYGIAAGCALLSLILITDFFKSLRRTLAR